MDASIQHLEASADADVPARSWLALVSAGELMAASLFRDRQVALRVVDGAEIRRLNRRFRGLDAATDVLSFPADDTLAARGHAGDIALCWDAVLAQAGHNGNSPEAEAVALTAHGLLHLAGYDHESEASEARMNQRTVELCRLAGYEVSEFGH